MPQTPHFSGFFYHVSSEPTKDTPGSCLVFINTPGETLGTDQVNGGKLGERMQMWGRTPTKRGGANGIVSTKLNGVLMSVIPTGDKAIKMLLAASRNYVKGDFSESLRHSLCQWNFLAKCHDINTQYSVICRISSPPRSTALYSISPCEGAGKTNI